MPDPPAEAMVPRTSRQLPTVALVSWASGEKYEKRLDEFRASYQQAGFAEAVLWKDADLKSFVAQLKHPMAKEFGRVNQHRPYCAAFKAAVLWYAMTKEGASDYVLWSDASQYASGSIRGNIRQAVERLQGRASRAENGRFVPESSVWRKSAWWTKAAADEHHIRSVYGQVHCGFFCGGLPLSNKVKNNIKDGTATEFKELLSGPWRSRFHILNSNILLENTPENRLLVWDWLSMYLAKPGGFCGSHTQDQAAFSILVENRTLPVMNACPYVTSRGMLPSPSKPARALRACFQSSKGYNWFIDAVAGGFYEVVTPEAYDTLFLQADGSPFPSELTKKR